MTKMFVRRRIEFWSLGFVWNSVLVIWDLKNFILEKKVRLNPFELCNLPIATQAWFLVPIYIRAENL